MEVEIGGECSEKCVKPAEIYFLTQRTPSAAQIVTECNLFETKSLCVSVKELRALCVIIALNGLTQFFEQSRFFVEFQSFAALILTHGNK